MLLCKVSFPATVHLQDLAGLAQTFLEVLTWTLLKMSLAPSSLQLVHLPLQMCHEIPQCFTVCRWQQFQRLMENFQLFIRIGGFWNTDVQLSPHLQPEFTHRKTTVVACRGDRVSQLCWVTDFQNLSKPRSGRFACRERCSEHSQGVTGFGQRKLPKANCTPPKDSLQPTKKKNPLVILADWTSFAQITYRCNPGTAEGTGNFAISVFGCVHTAWKEPSQRSGKPSIWPLFSTHGYLTPFQVWLVWLLHRRDASGSQDARERRSSWAHCCACRLAVCKVSLEGGLRMSAYQLVKTLKMDTSRNKWLLILLLNIFINHLLSGNANPTDFKC